MSKRRRFDRVLVDASKARRREGDGALIVPGRFARTGLQVYQNADGSDRIEYRPRDEVVASASTFEGVAITDRHPPNGEFISPSNWQELSRGHMQGIHVIEDADETWLEGDIVIGAGGLADAVERGDRSELSAGYYTDFIEQPVEYKGTMADGSQVAIVGNHVATLGRGEARAGRGARMLLDSNGHEITPPGVMPGEGKGNHMPIRIDSRGVAYEVDGAQAEGLRQSLEHERADHARELEAAKSEATVARNAATEAQAKADAAATQVTALTAELNAARDPAQRAKDAAELQELMNRAKVVAGKAVDLTGTPHEIRIAALKAGGEDVVAGIPTPRKEDSAYIEAYTCARFDAAYTLRKDARASVVSPPRTNTQAQDDPIQAALARRDAERAAMSRQLRGLPPVERS